MFKKFLGLIAIAICSSIPLFAAPLSQGEALERQLWSQIMSKNWAEVQNYMSSDFQGLHLEGVTDRFTEIAHLKTLTPVEFVINNVVVTGSSGVVVVTYQILTRSPGSAPNSPPQSAITRLSVWRFSNDTWKWIAVADNTAAVVSTAVPSAL